MSADDIERQPLLAEAAGAKGVNKNEESINKYKTAYVCMHICSVYIHLSISIYIYTYIYIHMYMYMCVCVCACVCFCFQNGCVFK